MKHCYRFFGECKDLSKNEQEWTLAKDERNHLVKILRLGLEETVEVFDGKGHILRGQISEISSSAVKIIGKPFPFVPPTSNSMALAVGALKPGFVDDLIPSLVELGMDEIHVFMQEGVAKNRLNEKVYARWNKIILTATKQCKRAYLPKIVCWDQFETMLKDFSNRFEQRLFLDPKGRSILGENIIRNTAISAVIGGEKGFSESEISLLENYKFSPHSLSKHILRAYTAAIATAAVLSAKSQIS